MQSVSCLAPFRAASSIAARVSAVSPDCEMDTTRVRSSITASRYRSSEELSASDGTRVRDSIHVRPTVAACRLVPIPVSTTLLNPAISSSENGMSSTSTSEASKETLPLNVFKTASGCSLISLSIKCSYSPLAAD